jgi:hypothetical protein
MIVEQPGFSVVIKVEKVSVQQGKRTGVAANGVWYNAVTDEADARLKAIDEGDTVKLTGQVNEWKGKKYLNVDSVDVIEASKEKPLREERVGTKKGVSTSYRELCGEENIIELQGKEYVTHQGLVNAAHKLGLQSITTEIISHDPVKQQAIIKATATMKDEDGTRTFQGIGDASPENLSGMVKAAYIRMAETRAVNRSLRLATKIAVTSIEELDRDN